MFSKLFKDQGKSANKDISESRDGDHSEAERVKEIEGSLSKSELERNALVGILDNVSSAIMVIDRDFVVTRANPATKTLFQENHAEFKKIFPTFDPSKIIGTCIDVFHKHPEHQRRLLADPSRLPYKAEIKVGALDIALFISAAFDTKGIYCGNILEWRNITEEKRKALDDLDYKFQLAAINKMQGVIEFTTDGNILAVNENFAKVTGYDPREIVGKHHSMFVDQSYKDSHEYREFWQKLARGEPDAGQYKRYGKDRKEIWLQASYNPIFDAAGKPFKVVKYATDITEEKLRNADYQGQLAAIHKIQGVIEFALDGTITAVNQNFAAVTGYSEKEIIGKHHSMFVEPSYKSSPEYKAFWTALGQGEANAGQYKRLGKGGKEIWLQASYNPIFDMNGKPFKVVKYATDITQEIMAQRILASAVEETKQIIQAAKSGDLADRIQLSGKTGQIAELCEGVNALMDNMAEIILQVKEAGETINTAAGEISTGNNDLSSRTEEQASSLEETASSMEQLAATVRNNSENAKHANQLAAEASNVAIKGGDVVSQVISTMNEINQSSRMIEDIITVIDGIAFQTNILALNAAVEAARAGEQGRGFAVVAGEVRNLAQRSASAAKEIKKLISDSVDKVKIGSNLVEEAGKTMEEIVVSVKRVTDIMSEISSASIEQSAGIDQVNTAVSQMDEVTQQNAALVEQAAAAAESLAEQAQSLVQKVNQYKLTKLDTGKNPEHPTKGRHPKLRSIV